MASGPVRIDTLVLRRDLWSESVTAPKQLRQWCRLDASTDRLLAGAADRLGFSARAISRVLKLARTIADLDQRERIESRDVAEALQYRVFDRVLRTRAQAPRPRGVPGNPPD